MIQGTRSKNWVIWIGAGISGGIGLLQAMGGWQRLNPDGVSYLDMGRVLVENKMMEGYTSYWAPLYGVLAWLAASLAELAGLDRLAGVQGLNVVLFLLNLLACHIFVRSLLGFLHIEADSLSGAATQLLALSTLCFLTVRLGGVTLVTPDLAVSATMLLVAALSLKLAQNQFSWWGAAGIGAAFGIGYWLKSIFFPAWVVWLGLAVVFLRSTPNWRRWILTAGAAWLAVAFPLVLKISEAAGRWSFGENARLSYFWYVHGIRNTYWEGDEADLGKPSHSMKKVFEDPSVFYFGDVFPKATYAPWYDPGYWHTGATLRFSATGLARAMKENLGRKRGLWKPRLFMPFLLVTIAGLWTGRRLLKEGAILWLLLFAGSPFLLVLIHMEPRFFYAQVTILVVLGWVSLQNRFLGAVGRWLAVGAMGLALWGWGLSARHVLQGSPGQLGRLTAALESAGVTPGMRLCSIGQGPSTGIWAWHAQVRVVAELPVWEYRRVMSERGVLPGEVEDAFRRAGCAAIVATLRREDPPPDEDWVQPVEDMPTYLKFLR